MIQRLGLDVFGSALLKIGNLTESHSFLDSAWKEVSPILLRSGIYYAEPCDALSFLF